MGTYRVEVMERPEIDSVNLRNILLDSVQGLEKWNQKLLKVEPDHKTKGMHNLHSADGSVESEFDLVVGADGAWLKVRPLLMDVKPFYFGITGIKMWALNVEERHAWLSKQVREMESYELTRLFASQKIGLRSAESTGQITMPFERLSSEIFIMIVGKM